MAEPQRFIFSPHAVVGDAVVEQHPNAIGPHRPDLPAAEQDAVLCATSKSSRVVPTPASIRSASAINSWVSGRRVGWSTPRSASNPRRRTQGAPAGMPQRGLDPAFDAHPFGMYVASGLFVSGAECPHEPVEE